MEDLKKIFDDFNMAIGEGKLEEAAKLRSQESKKSIEDNCLTAEEKAGTLQMLQAMIPLSVVVSFLDQKENKASLYLLATFKNFDIPTETVCQELEVRFVKEDSQWKMGTIMYLADPNDIKKSADDNFELKENYDLEAFTLVGGRIREVKFEKDYTLVKIKMLDEEDLIFLPNKENLEKSGFSTGKLVPYAVIQVDGHKHKTNPLKIWGDKVEIVEVE